MLSLQELLGSDPFANLDIPPLLEASIARHRTHLAQLVHTMKTAGISDTQIEQSVTVLIDSYKTELLAAIRSMNQ